MAMMKIIISIAVTVEPVDNQIIAFLFDGFFH